MDASSTWRWARAHPRPVVVGLGAATLLAALLVVLTHDGGGTDGKPAQPAGASGAPVSLSFHATSSADAPDVLPGDGACAAADGLCTLRAAFDELAVAGSGSTGRVELDGQTYRLASVLSLAHGNVTLVGADRAKTVIDGQDKTRLVDVSDGGSLTLDRLTVTNGAADEEGGAVRVYDGRLTVSDVSLSSSAAGGNGGAIYAAGSVVSIDGSSFDQTVGLAGGALAVDGGELTVRKTTFGASLASGVGGAVAVSAARAVTVDGATFSNNISELSGGALYLAGAMGPSAYAVTGSTFTSNQAYGGSGGGIATDGLVGSASTGQLAVTGSTFTGNRADRSGAAIFSPGVTTSNGNTFRNNAAGDGTEVVTPISKAAP